MIIGDNREAVIENIKTAAESGDFYAKVELSDPELSSSEKREIINKYLKKRNTAGYRIKKRCACFLADLAMKKINADTEIVGAEKLRNLDGGAIITSNHFSPLENTIVRYMVTREIGRPLAIVSQVTNFAMKGLFGFLMNYANTVPISTEPRYISKRFIDILKEKIDAGEAVLIYPEQEMWFNYRKPRPPKLGAYHFAAKIGCPVISCFVEIIDLPDDDTEKFKKVKYRVHILDVLHLDPELSPGENSENMCENDYRLKVEAYERVYNRQLDYSFERFDIAGLKEL